MPSESWQVECSKTVPKAAGGGRGRVEMHSNAGGVRRACVDLLYLRHVGHRQTISMPSSEFC